MTETNHPRWQQILAEAITDPKELFQLLKLDISLLPAAQFASESFKLRVPRGFVSRIQPGNLNDPLLRQILPIDDEQRILPGFSTDPLQEKSANPTTGVLHKYQGRLLLLLTGACAINCRYCFRRHFPYEENQLNPSALNKALDYIRAHPDIHEVILSGGDPLLVSDGALAKLLSTLSEIPHLKTLRIHSRLPIVLPERITESFLQLMQNTPLKKVLVIHANHAQEINTEVGEKLLALDKAGVTLLNQSVLLKGVNDDASTLTALSHALFQYQVLPYYLHLLDAVQGAAHFWIPDTQAQEIHKNLQTRLPGYLVPRLVREIPEEKSKQWIR